MRKAFLSLLLCLAGVWQAAAASIWLADLRCENLTNPLGQTACAWSKAGQTCGTRAGWSPMLR